MIDLDFFEDDLGRAVVALADTLVSVREQSQVKELLLGLRFIQALGFEEVVLDLSGVCVAPGVLFSLRREKGLVILPPAPCAPRHPSGFGGSDA